MDSSQAGRCYPIMPPLPDLSIVQLTFLSYLAGLEANANPVAAADLRAAVRPVFDVARGAMFYQVMNRLDARGLVDKSESITPGTTTKRYSLSIADSKREKKQ